jgi:uncharacterized tellurite resistance protein B-like protein
MTLKVNHTYSAEESLSIVQLVWMLLFSDREVDSREVHYFERLSSLLEVDREALSQGVSAEALDKAFSVVRKMPMDKRRECGTLLRLAVTSDGVVELSELSRLNDILERAAVFRLDRSVARTKEGGF